MYGCVRVYVHVGLCACGCVYVHVCLLQCVYIHVHFCMYTPPCCILCNGVLYVPTAISKCKTLMYCIYMYVCSFN